MALRISSIASSTSSQGVLAAGAVVTFTVGLNQPAVVNGSPVLLLNDGGVAIYDPVLSTPNQVPSILYFHYEVKTGDVTPDLTVVDMSLAGGSIYSSGSLFLGDPSAFNVGSEPVSVVASDINHDNKPDLLVANAGDGTVSVLKNTGQTVSNIVGQSPSIQFGPAFAYAAGVQLQRSHGRRRQWRFRTGRHRRRRSIQRHFHS